MMSNALIVLLPDSLHQSHHQSTLIASIVQVCGSTSGHFYLKLTNAGWNVSNPTLCLLSGSVVCETGLPPTLLNQLNSMITVPLTSCEANIFTHYYMISINKPFINSSNPSAYLFYAHSEDSIKLFSGLECMQTLLPLHRIFWCRFLNPTPIILFL